MTEPWYREAFRGHYLSVYRHRDDESAAAEAAFAVRALGISPGDSVLDVACGAGRHARALVDLGLHVVGIDLSEELLVEARRLGRAGYARADMRRLPVGGGFHAVTLFFTSFGYFETDDEHREVLAESGSRLRPGGSLLLDFMNRDRILATLIPHSDEEVSGARIRSDRWITPDGHRVEKRVRVSREGRLVEDYTESVRLYTPDEVCAMLASVGLPEVGRYGDLAGSPFAVDSPRLVVVGRKAC